MEILIIWCIISFVAGCMGYGKYILDNSITFWIFVILGLIPGAIIGESSSVGSIMTFVLAPATVIIMGFLMAIGEGIGESIRNFALRCQKGRSPRKLKLFHGHDKYTPEIEGHSLSPQSERSQQVAYALSKRDTALESTHICKANAENVLKSQLLPQNNATRKYSMKCPVCKTDISDSDNECNVCGFPIQQHSFISTADATDWINEVVIPYRCRWVAEQNRRSKNNHDSIDFSEISHKA